MGRLEHARHSRARPHLPTVVPLLDQSAPYIVLRAVSTLAVLAVRMHQPRPCATIDGRPAVLWTLPDVDGLHCAVIVAASRKRNRYDVICAQDGRRVRHDLKVRPRDVDRRIGAAVRDASGVAIPAGLARHLLSV